MLIWYLPNTGPKVQNNDGTHRRRLGVCEESIQRQETEGRWQTVIKYFGYSLASCRLVVTSYLTQITWWLQGYTQTTLDSLFLVFAVRNQDFHKNHVGDVLYNQYIHVDTVNVNFYLITSGRHLVTLMSIFNRISIVFLSLWLFPAWCVACSVSSCLVQTHPDFPKKPLTPYFRFFMEKRAKYAKIHPEMSNLDLTKILSKKYKELPDKKKVRSRSHLIGWKWVTWWHHQSKWRCRCVKN